MKGNPYEAAHSRFWIIFIEILIGNERNSVSGSQEQILIDFHFNSGWKLKEIRLRHPIADSDSF